MRALPVPLLAALALGACGDPPPARTDAPRDTIALRALMGIPVMPGAVVTGLEGTGQAAQATVRVPASADSAARWYRRQLLAGAWSIVSDVRAPDGTVTLHATRAGRGPVWLILTQDSPGGPTSVTVVGAVPDSTRP